jgi:SAM-dependent methyltransferase
VSSITAIDASQMMIDRYKARIDELGGRHRNTIAIKGNLLTDPPEPLALVEENYHSFSLITVGAALHHFPDTEHAVICLVERLRPGGVLYIQDLFDDGHGDLDGKRPRGFTLDGLRSVLSSVSLVDFSFQVLPDAFEVELPSEEVLKVQFFVAKAMKPIAK